MSWTCESSSSALVKNYLKLFDDHFSVVAGAATRDHKEWINPFNTVISVEKHFVTRENKRPRPSINFEQNFGHPGFQVKFCFEVW